MEWRVVLQESIIEREKQRESYTSEGAIQLWKK